MTFHIITLFPKSFDSYLKTSILKRAIFDKKIKVKFYDPKDFSEKRSHYAKATPGKKVKSEKRVDDKPYGGGPGMIIRALPVIKAIKKAVEKKKKVKIIYLSPNAKKYTNVNAKIFSEKFKDVVIVCGRYEGIDARVKEVWKGEEFSVGDFVLTGGEIPAMIIIDTISRQVRGVLGSNESIEENRVASPNVYTRPEKFKYKGKEYFVPKVLLGGNHAEIENWRKNVKNKK